MRLLGVILTWLLCASAHAEWIDKQGNPIPDSDDRKSNGQFIAQLIFITDEQEFFNKWGTPSESVYLDSVDSITINHPISFFVIFGGCQPDPDGNCNVTMQFKVTQPDGKVYMEPRAEEQQS